jgi:DNA-binding NarL/FixJ family response regulator
MNNESQPFQLLNKSWVAYLNLDGENINYSDIELAENGIDGEIEVCNSWFNLICMLHTRQIHLHNINSDDPSVVIIHVSSLVNHGTTMSEITDMLITLNKCLTLGRGTMVLGALVDKTCTTELIRQIRNAGFVGLIPTCDVLGIDKTIEGFGALLSSQSYWNKEVIDVLANKPKKTVSRRDNIVLTARQQDVMGLICRGLPNKQIARILRIADSTVKIHVTAILREYGLRTRTQLALAGSQPKGKL